MADCKVENTEDVNCNHNETRKSNYENKETGFSSKIDIDALDKKRNENYVALYKFRVCDKVRNQVDAHPPSIQELLDARRNIYISETLNEIILSYDNLSFGYLYERSLLYQFQDHDDDNFDDELLELYELFRNYENFTNYETAVRHLKNKKVTRANEILLDLVNDGIEPAIYAYVIVFLKELLRQCDILNPTEENAKVIERNKDDIIVAAELLKRASLMEPARSFLCGMMKKFDIGGCRQFIGDIRENDLCYVVNVANNHGFLNLDHDILDIINFNNRWGYEKCGIGMQRKGECLKQMGRYSVYEIALSMSSDDPFEVNIQRELLMVLSKDDEFPEALYSYAAALLQKKLGSTLNGNIKKAKEYLKRAAIADHEEARFLLGIFPFHKRFFLTLSSEERDNCIRALEYYINSSYSSCIMNENNINKAAYALAVEYYSKHSYIVGHDKSKAVQLLKSRQLVEELHKLQALIR